MLTFAAGGDARLCVWNVVSGELLQEICDVFHGAVETVCWIDFGGRKEEGFAFGCSNGTIHVYKWNAMQVSGVGSLILNAR